MDSLKLTSVKSVHGLASLALCIPFTAIVDRKTQATIEPGRITLFNNPNNSQNRLRIPVVHLANIKPSRPLFQFHRLNISPPSSPATLRNPRRDNATTGCLLDVIRLQRRHGHASSIPQFRPRFRRRGFRTTSLGPSTSRAIGQPFPEVLYLEIPQLRDTRRLPLRPRVFPPPLRFRRFRRSSRRHFPPCSSTRKSPHI